MRILTIDVAFLLNCFSRAVTLSDTLKKSYESHIHATHLHHAAHQYPATGAIVKRREYAPTPELCPLYPC